MGHNLVRKREQKERLLENSQKISFFEDAYKTLLVTTMPRGEHLKQKETCRRDLPFKTPCTRMLELEETDKYL